jgi:pimeloyl-ACP methyl ester carboxylesterase
MAIVRILYDMRPGDLLPRVKLPLLVIQAVGGDPNNEREATFLRMKQQGAERVQYFVPEAKIVWLENTIHDIPLHRPEKLAHEMLDFFKGCNLTSDI